MGGYRMSFLALLSFFAVIALLFVKSMTDKARQ